MGGGAKPPRGDANQCLDRHIDLPEGCQQGRRSPTCHTYIAQATIRQGTQGELLLSNTTAVEEWGDSFSIKEDDCYRFVSKNIGSLGVGANSLKEDQLKEWMRSNQIVLHFMTCREHNFRQ